MRVAVVGAGPAGCTAAYRLARLGYEVVVFESEPRVGGRTWTLRDGGLTIDTGAFYVCSFYRHTLALIDELGHSQELVAMPRETGLVDPPHLRMRWTVGAPSALLRAPGLRPTDRLRLGLVFMAKSRSKLDPYDTAQLAAADTGESVADWARRVVGDRAFENFVRPSFEPWWLFSCETGAATVCSSSIRDASGMRLYAVRGGTDRICSWLLDGLEVQLETPIASLAVDGSKASLITAAGDAVEAEGIVLATDANVASQILGDTPAGRRLATVPYAKVTHVSLVFGENRWRDHPYSTHPANPRARRAGTVALVSGKLPELVPQGSEVIDVYLSDSASRAIAGEDEAVAVAREEAEAFLGAPVPEPDRAYVFARARGVVMPPPGHYAEMQKALLELPERVRLAGDYLSVSVVEAAIRAGERAAAELATVMARSRPPLALAGSGG